MQCFLQLVHSTVFHIDIRNTHMDQSDIFMLCQQIIAAGFTGASESVCTAFGLERDARGNLPASEGNHRTSVPKVFTAGDMRRGQSLVVWAVSEGREAAAEVDSFLMGYTDLI